MRGSAGRRPSLGVRWGGGDTNVGGGPSLGVRWDGGDTNGVTDLIAGGAHSQIYYFILSRQSLYFISGRKDGCALTQRIENAPGGSLIDFKDRKIKTVFLF